MKGFIFHEIAEDTDRRWRAEHTRSWIRVGADDPAGAAAVETDAADAATCDRAATGHYAGSRAAGRRGRAAALTGGCEIRLR